VTSEEAVDVCPRHLPTDPQGLEDPVSDRVTQGIAEDPTRVKRKKTIISRGGTDRDREISPHDVTVDAGSDKSKTQRSLGTDADGLDNGPPKTHFQTVSDTQPRISIFESTLTNSGSAWTQWLSIAGMLGVLILGGALVIYAFRPPSADQLYQAVVNGGDMDAARSFMRSFPQDDRYEEVVNAHMASRLSGVMNRLRVQAKVGLTTLDASEEGFFHAMTGREQDPVGSMDRLQNWLNVYDNSSDSADRTLDELVELAKHEHQQLAIRAPEIIVDPRAQELIDDILQTVAEQSPSAIRKKLTGIVETFAHADWAGPAIAEAQAQLAILEQRSAATDDPSGSGESQ
jgi:hypothetical protein